MKKKLSPRQWIGAVLLLLLFILTTLFLYSRFHGGSFLKEDSRFEKFALDLFLTELSSNPINLHYTLTDASAYGIEESALTLPVYQTGQSTQQLKSTESALLRLQKFHPENMSSSNQYTYLLLATYLSALKNCSSYLYYEEPLSPASGAQSELPILLAEYRISSVEDIENYLSILSQIPAYLEGIMRYEQEKADKGLFMSDASADKVIEQCTMLMNPAQLQTGEHFLEVTFQERLAKLIEQNLISEADSEAWESEHKRLLTTVVAPAYDKLADELTLLKGSGTPMQGLACYPNGKEYYTAYLRLNTGSYRTIPEIKKMLAQDFEKNYTALLTLMQQYPTLTDSSDTETDALLSLTPEEMLSQLQTMITQDYPALPDNIDGEPITCTIKYVDECLAPYTAPAFYLTPPIDDTQENTIYINNLDTGGGLSLFTTLAHEGYPGHLYQTLYSSRRLQTTDTTPLRSILSYGGYVEGWAMYVELNSYDYAIRLVRESHPELESLYQADRLNRQIQLCLYSLLDILIHYEGASYERVYSILSAIGFREESDIRAVYEYIVEEPCNYLKYYLGYLEIEALKNQAQEAWKDSYTDYQFHTFLLDNGPADFRTLSRLLTIMQTG
ncbi:MAG: DUF885 domain-containing protein [Muribaculaceae bacterium]|nr:DUF885 domain-containing protein [Muribaculaceae bacterium]